MRTSTAIIIVSALIPHMACAGCLGFGDEPDNARFAPNSERPAYDQGTDAGGEFDDPNDASGDHGVGADMGQPTDASPGQDMAGVDARGTDADGPDSATEDMPTAQCGDGDVTGPEICDDGNVSDGDYCSADCLQETGSCGDGVLQTGELCDDGVTVDCAGTHDGGNGSCVPTGTCASGYVLSGATCVANSTGLTEPCQNGSGFTLFRYHYSNNSTSAQLDVWDANCSYSFAPGSACNVYEICPGFCDPDVTSDGYPVFDTSDYMRARFNVNGLNFSQATLHVQARSYATSSSTNFRVWSPLYGETFGGPVDNDFVYDWYSVDWTGYLYPSDDPGLTAIQLYGSNGRVAVKAVELCVE